ncbi:MAG: carbon-nitrogen hydrolase family protein [Pseudomonadota bacterium]|uniref:carbon-nitrogen hydrolase family protein n=1 Tax=Fodinicurvata fenggangensis TaxID=1121830 RepID=UPI00068E8289|nr:nitrilase-related carbon-nitrogen hydrolase [Fodinicurvata fenggangensis]
MPENPNEIVVSAIQITAEDGEKDATVAKMLDLLDTAGQRGTQLCVLPELWTGLGFSDESIYRSIAEPIPGPVTQRLAEKARQYGMYIAGSMYEEAGSNYFNTIPLITPEGEVVGKYRKTHLFDAPNRTDIPPGIMESKKVKAGDNLNVYQTGLGKVGLSVCSDLRFPEIYREMALKGSEILVCASAFLSPRYDHWEFFLRARATENQCFVIASGQYGTEPKSGLGFVGRSMIVDPWGTVVATASDREECVTAHIDRTFIQEVKRRYPLMDQRRPELYSTLRSA